MPECDCGAVTGRYMVHMEAPDGTPLKQSYTSCPTCRPEEFPPDAFAPSLDRLVTGPEAMPTKYKLGMDGVYRPSDELMQDTQDLITAEGPTGEREREQRATRRTTPMTEVEIAAAQRWGNDWLKPQLSH